MSQEEEEEEEEEEACTNATIAQEKRTSTLDL